MVAADLDTAILIATRLRERDTPIRTEGDVAAWVDAFIDILLVQRRKEREDQLRLARELGDPTIESFSDDVTWLKRIEDLRAANHSVPQRLTRSRILAEGRLLGRLLDPDISRLVERRVLQAVRPPGKRPRGLEPEQLALCVVGVAWDVSASTVRRIVHRHRSGWRSALESYAVADALAAVEHLWATDVPLSLLLKVLAERESVRRAELRRRQRRTSQLWRWASTWPIPSSAEALRAIVKRMELRVTSSSTVETSALSAGDRKTIRAAAKLAEYPRDDADGEF